MDVREGLRMLFVLIGDDLEAGDAGADRAFDIAFAIADEKAFLHIDRKVFRCTLYHGDTGFTAFAGDSVSGNLARRMMGAEVNPIETHLSLFFELFLKRCVENVDIAFLEIAARDSRLIADDDQEVAHVLQFFEGFRDVGENFEILDFMNITAVADDNAIAVEKSSGSSILS